MMRIGGTPAAHQAGLLHDRFHMLPVANPPGHRQRQNGFVDTRCPISPSAASSKRFRSLGDCGLVGHKGRELQLKGQLDLFGVGSSETSFCSKNPTRPVRGDTINRAAH